MPETSDLENRFTYHPPTPAQVPIYVDVREAGLRLAQVVNRYAPESRELSLALTHIEEAVMWANAAIARHGLRKVMWDNTKTELQNRDSS